jgi:hypothetical protein
MHVHVISTAGEAKYWLEPEIELARNHGLAAQHLTRIREIIVARQDEIRHAWNDHFGS